MGIYIPLTFLVQSSLPDPAGSVARWSAVDGGGGASRPTTSSTAKVEGRGHRHTGDSRKQRQGRARSMTDTLTGPDILPQAIVV